MLYFGSSCQVREYGANTPVSQYKSGNTQAKGLLSKPLPKITKVVDSGPRTAFYFVSSVGNVKKDQQVL